MDTSITRLLNIEYPLLVAPMFLISNETMVVEALRKGVTAAIPALNFRKPKELGKAINNIRTQGGNSFGVNLIVNRSNLQYREQLDEILEHKPSYIITSLGNPKEAIQACKAKGIKVFCDVVDVKTAIKVESLGADAIIAVCKEAGGHAGNIPVSEFIPLLKKECNIPIIAAGGVANSDNFMAMLKLGADAVSVGTVFLASKEANISDEYRSAIIKYGKDDIVRTTKLSGASLTVINTPYVQKIGVDANIFEKLLNRNKRLKNFIKSRKMKRGSKSLERAALSATYKNVWCAGPAIEYINQIRPIADIIEDIIE